MRVSGEVTAVVAVADAGIPFSVNAWASMAEHSNHDANSSIRGFLVCLGCPYNFIANSSTLAVLLRNRLGHHYHRAGCVC